VRRTDRVHPPKSCPGSPQEPCWRHWVGGDQATRRTAGVIAPSQRGSKLALGASREREKERSGATQQVNREGQGILSVTFACEVFCELRLYDLPVRSQMAHC
jgi:hypothetical protein